MPPITYVQLENKDMQSVTERLSGTNAATAGNYGCFFIASRPYEVMEIRAVWSALGTDAGAVTLNVERLQGTTAEGAGDNIIATAIDLKGAINTVNVAKTTALQNRLISTGDRLALVDTGVLTAVNNLVVTVLLKPRGKGDYK